MDNSKDQSLTAFIASEDALVKEAALALPHSFDKCTYELGPIRQAVHLCLTCGIPQGMCSACSVACHGDHEQIELFPKRGFVCDCPTRIGDRDCTLYQKRLSAVIPPKNTKNIYGQNFSGKFCRCHRAYDARRERETMVQCLVCEDWFHESCLNLRTRPRERGINDAPDVCQNESVASVVDGINTGDLCDPDMAEARDSDSECSNDLPPCLLSASKYDTFICGNCVLGNATLRRWAGTVGIMMVYSDVPVGGNEETPVIVEGGIDPRWKTLESDVSEDITVVASDVEDIDARPVKRRRTEDDLPKPTPATSESPICIAPPANTLAQRILAGLENKENSDTDSSGQVSSHGDIFLTEGWRDRWCKCPKCLPPLESQPCLLEEETTYEPPDDPDSGLSFEQLGMRALLNLPRDRAIDGIHAYNTMRDELVSYLRPFAEEGRIVREEDVRHFFETKLEEQLTKG